MNKLNLLLILLFLSLGSMAQRKQVHGYLRDSVTHFPIIYGTVTNSTINKKVHSNSAGLFSIEAAPKDFLYAYAMSYKYDTLLYSYINTDTITIYLSPAGTILPGVTVTSKYNKYQLDSIRRKASFEEGRGPKMKTVSAANSSGFGIGINLDKIFKTKDKHQKSSERVMLSLEKEAYVSYRFSPYIVSHYTGLKGSKLQDFINKNTPTYEWLREHPANEDVLYYINEKLRKPFSTPE